MESDQEALDEEFEAIEVDDADEIAAEIQGAMCIESTSPLIIGNDDGNLVHDLENYLLDSDFEDEVRNIQKAGIGYEDYSIVDSDSERSEFEVLEHVDGAEKLAENLDVISVSSNWSDVSKKLREVESSDENTSDDGEDEKLDETSEVLHVTDDLPSPLGELSSNQDDEESACFSLKSRKEKSSSNSRHQQQKMASGVSATSHSKSKSKRQKRRAKERRLLVEMGENSILKQISGILDNANTLRSQGHDAYDQEKDLYKNVPSLSLLCVQTLKSSSVKDKLQKLGLNVNENLPSGLRNVITVSNEEHSMKKLSEHWMAYVLSYYEKVWNLKDSLDQLNEKDPGGFLFSDILFSRNVWNLLPYRWNDKCGYYYNKHYCRHGNNQIRNWTMYFYDKAKNDADGGSMRSALLHFTFWMMYITLDQNTYYSAFPTSVSLNFIKAVFASYIDISMPALRETDRQRVTSPSAGSSPQSDGMKKLMAKMKTELTKRFPVISNTFYDEVIPYVHWARGDLTNAAVAFRALVEDEEKGTSAFMKMRCLTEIGRMYAQFGWTNSARLCFKESCDLSWTNHNLGIDEVKGQMLMMIANLYDQGMMTAEKFKLSKKAWESVLSDHYSFKERAAMASADALLCIHAGKYDDVGIDWLHDVKQRLLSIVKQDVHVAYHLSFVCAFLGQRKESDEHYGQFINSFEEKSQAPGMKLVEMNMKRKTQKHNEEALTLTTENPFDPLITLTSKVKVQPLQVVWRTQLHPCRYSENSVSYVADLCSRDPRLRISEEGLLTGNLQLQLPPIKSLCLNPYTGDIVLGRPGDVGTWKSTKDFDWSEEQRYFSTLTPMEVFHDPHSGVKVHLIMPRDPTKLSNSNHCYYNQGSHLKRGKSKPQWRQPPSLVKLYWTGPNGQRAKLNLISKLKDVAYQKCKETLETTYKGSTQYMEMSMSMLENCYKNDKILDAREIISFTSTLVKKENADEVYRKKKHKDIPKRNKMKYSPKSFTIRLRKRPLCFGSCLLLIFTLEEMNLTNYIVFVNCASRDTFVNPRIEEFEVKNMLEGEPRNVKGNRIQRAEVFCWKNHLDSLTMRDVNGEQVSEEKISRASLKSYVIVGRTLVTLMEKGDIVFYHGGRYYHTYEFLEVESIDLLGQILVVRNKYGVGFADTTSFPSIKPMKIIPRDSATGKLLGIEVSENQEQINVEFTEHFAVLGSEQSKKNGIEFERYALGLSNYLVVLKFDFSSHCDNSLHISLILELPGFATDVCFVHEQVGFLVTWTQDPGRSSTYPDREWLYHYDFGGNLLGILPFLGPGPRSLCPAYLRGEESVQEKHRGFGTPGWYVYLQDGYDGIMGVRLNTKSTEELNQIVVT